MAALTIGGKPANTIGDLPATGSKAPSFTLTATDMSSVSLSDLTGSRLVLNIFPCVETGTCSASVRRFNEIAAGLDNTRVICISRDTPFTQKRFCGAEGIEGVMMLSDYGDRAFGRDYQMEFRDGFFNHLLSRVVMVIEPGGEISYVQQVQEVSQEPDYEDVLKHLSR